MNREKELRPLPDGSIKLGAEHFRRIIRRIESIKPVDSPDGLVKVKEKDGSASGLYFEVQSTARGVLTCSTIEVQQYSFNTVTLQVCCGSSFIELVVLSVATISTIGGILVEDPEGTIVLATGEEEQLPPEPD